MATRGLFLDLDGTLADTLPALRGVYRKFLRQFGYEGSDVEFESVNGPPLDVVVAQLARSHGLHGDHKALLAQYRGLVAEVCKQAAARPGAHEILERARSRGWVVAVVTSGDQAASRIWLERAGFAMLVTVVVGGDEVERGKPDPAPYRLALRRAACVADKSMAVEDSIQGARSALAAGVPTWLLGQVPDHDLAGTTLYRGRLASLGDLAAKL